MAIGISNAGRGIGRCRRFGRHRKPLGQLLFAAWCVAIVACTQEEGGECIEDGGCGCPDGGLTDDGGVAPLPFRYAVIVDYSEVGLEPWSYTAGADVCGVVADCGGELHFGSAAELVSGYRGDCAADQACSRGVVRDDARAALDDGASCGLSGDRSDFVSLGAQGELIVEFDIDLRGCSVMVREHPQDDGRYESFYLFVCQTGEPTGCGCGTSGPLASPAGDVTYAVPLL